MRAIAYYLPQFHPIPENDAWWGPGFTEWTNVAKARRLFPGHYQPHVPADLGFYDLRLSESRIAQAELAKLYGIEAFCYYHYWFAGHQLLERPFREVLASGEPDFGFCLCWANQTWSGIWHGLENRTLIEQTYPGEEDHRKHFAALLPAFQDKRYVRVDGKPLFVIYNPRGIPDAIGFTDLWRKLAEDSGLPGLFLVGETSEPEWDPKNAGLDASIVVRLPTKRRTWVPWSDPYKKIAGKIKDVIRLPTVHQYQEVMKTFLVSPIPGIESFPTVIPNWDNTPRSGKKGMVLHGSTPELFRQHLREAIHLISRRPESHRIFIIKSWNEWAEGNHLEPDLKFGHRYLQVFQEEMGI